MLKCSVCCGLLLLMQMCISVSCECLQCPPPDSSDGWFSELMVCDIGSRNATLMWSRDADTSVYIVLYRPIATENQIRSEPISGDEAIFTHVITDLTPETNYSVQVCQEVLDTCGNCMVNFRTLAAQDPSGPPTNLMLLASGPSTLFVSWSAPAINPEVVLEYVIRRTRQNNVSDVRETTRIDTNDAVTLRNLIPNTVYICEVFTRSRFGDSPAATDSARTPPRETIPGLIFTVNRGLIEYNQLTESSLRDFFSILEDSITLLNVGDTANITGVDYHFNKQELFVALTSGIILSYNLSVSETDTGTLSIGANPPLSTVYTNEGSMLGSITVDWLNDTIYWIEYEGSMTKVNRMAIGTNEVPICEVAWEGRFVKKIVVDPVHGYMYWNVLGDEDNNGFFRGPLGMFRESQTAVCPSTVPAMEMISLSPTLLDFVLEPDVFIYYIADSAIHFVGFDKQNNGTIEESNAMLVESFGDVTVGIRLDEARRCNATTRDCFTTPANVGRPVNDILVFRKSKQPLPIPPSHPTGVRVFTGSTTASISWERLSFVQSFFGLDAYDDWLYCVNYSVVGMSDVNKTECTNGLQTTLTSLESNTLYRFVVSAIGPGGERVPPDVSVFRTKPVGSENATLLFSTDTSVMTGGLDGSDLHPISAPNDVLRESNGVAYDFRNDLYFWIVAGGQGPLYRYTTLNSTFARVQRALDRPVSLAADWVGRRLFWVQEGISVLAERQLASINMDENNENADERIVTEDPSISAIAVDSLHGRVFWITGNNIMTKYLNSLEPMTCCSLESEPLALTVDTDNQYLYWMTFDTVDNTVSLSQLNYTTKECGTRPVTIELSGIILERSPRGALTYGLGTLYLTTVVSSRNQSVYVFPADFASIDKEFTLAFGVIPHRDVVRDVTIVSEMLQPLPGGLVTPGLSGVTAKPLSAPPSLRGGESSTSVIVIEWGESPTNIAQPILYEVDFTLTPFGESARDPVKEFTEKTFLRLEGQSFFTEVMVTVTPHTLWVKSTASQSRTSIFHSPPRAPEQVMNVRSYVYHPILDNDDDITALIVWDALSATEAGGIVGYYHVKIKDVENNNTVLERSTTGNESCLIVRVFDDLPGGIYNVLTYPLQSGRTYEVQVFAANDGGNGTTSEAIHFSTDGVSPPQQLLFVTNSGSLLSGAGVTRSYEAVNPVAINTLSRLMYWYDGATNSIMVQSLDGNDTWVFLESSPVTVSAMSYEWQGERLYMAGFNNVTERFELWRVPVVYVKGIWQVYEMSPTVQSVSSLVVDSFRKGAAFWLQELDEGISLAYLDLSNTSFPALFDLTPCQQEILHFTDLITSAITLDPATGELWMSNGTSGGIFVCTNESCQEVVDSSTTGTTVVSIGLDENNVYWTNGSVIKFINRSASGSSPMVFGVFDENEVISLHSLSPGQQPQYLSCDATTTCLAPAPRSLPGTTMNNTTNTSIELWWSFPPLPECCADVVFSYPLVEYTYSLVAGPIDFDDLFATHLMIGNLTPLTTYSFLFYSLNIYSVRDVRIVRPDLLLASWISVTTRPGVPDPVNNLDATAFGITCINVTWSDPGVLRGLAENVVHVYFVTFSDGSSNMTLNADNANFLPLTNITPGVNYSIQVISIDGDGKDQESNVMNVNDTLPLPLTFNISDVTPYTRYRVFASATYAEIGCSINSYPGEYVMFRTNPGVPDTPELFINDGIATWSPVNSRSSMSDPVSYILTAATDGVEVGRINQTGTSFSNNITQDLSEESLNLQVGEIYMICVTVKNMIGYSMPDCVESYTHTVPGTPEPPSISDELSVELIAGIAGGAGIAALILLLVLCACGLWVYRRREKKALGRLAYAYGPDLELTSVRAQRYHRTNAPHNQQNMWSREDFVATEEELALLNQFPRQSLTLQTFIGQGEFGEVFQGTAIDILGPETGPHPVAIKTFRKGASNEERHKFLSEAALMGKFSHPNIVKILAVCVDNDPVFIIMELMPAGDLLKFLRDARPETGPALLTREEQIHICLDVAQGCRYLEQQHFIHRDLAARNCLVSSKGADRVVKIGDFGLAKDLYSSDYYRVEGERKLPVRWMAPEALLQGKFTIESDVWAYGVLLHEIMSFGNQPYPGQSNQDVLQFVTAGGRLPKPDNCPQKIYRIMMQCWRKYASERPRFEEICNILDAILEDMHRESYCESESDDGDTLSREGSKRLPSRSPSFKSGFQNLVRTGSKKLRNSLRRHSMLRKEDQATHNTSVSSCANLLSSGKDDSFRESELI